MGRYTALYKIECYNDERNSEGKYATIRCGVLTVTDFTDAMRQIESYYGAELITVHFIELYDTDHLVVNENHFETLQALVKEVLL